MGARKKYTKKQLAEAVDRYFDSISRVVEVTEPVPTGERDEKGHMIFEDRPVKNRLGETVMREEYLVPPTVGGLADFLGIHRSTWTEGYCQDPKYSDTTTHARGRMESYLEQELLTRPGKDTKGVEFQLQNNFGKKQKMEISAGEGLEEYLKSIAESGGGQTF